MPKIPNAAKVGGQITLSSRLSKKNGHNNLGKSAVFEQHPVSNALGEKMAVTQHDSATSAPNLDHETR